MQPYEIVKVQGGTGKTQKQPYKPKQAAQQPEDKTSRSRPGESTLDVVSKMESHKETQEKMLQEKIADRTELYTMNWCEALSSSQPVPNSSTDVQLSGSKFSKQN